MTQEIISNARIYAPTETTEVTISGLTFTDGVYAGASWPSAKITEDAAVSNLTGNARIFLNAPTVGIQGITISNLCSNDNGIGIRVDGGDLVVVEQSSFIGNTCTYNFGGGIYDSSTALEVGNSYFSGNTAKHSGGAIGTSSTAESVTITKTLFHDNCGQYYGGAIYLQGGSANISGSTFSGNRAGSKGGAIMANNTTLTLSGVTFSTASDTIYTERSVVDFTGRNVINAGISLWNSTFSATNATLVFDNASDITIVNLAMNGSNSVVFDGSATVYFTTQDLRGVNVTVGADILPVSGTVTVASGISNMDSTITVGGQSVALGDEVVYHGGTYTFALSGTALTATLTANSWYDIYAPTATTEVVAAGETFYGVYQGASVPTGWITSDSVIAGEDLNRQIYVNGPVVALKDTSVTNVCVNDVGAGLRIKAAERVILDNVLFSGDTGSYNYGGGIYDNSTQMTVADSTFSGNSAAHSGGALYHVGGTVNVSDTVFDRNSARYYGGAVDIAGGTATFVRAVFTGNTTYERGNSALHTESGDVSIADSIFAGNVSRQSSSDGHAGAAGFWGSGVRTISGSTFSGNFSSRDGGAVESNNVASILRISGSTFSGNTATNNGGAITNVAGTVEITGSVLDGNSVSGHGSAINMTAGSLAVNSTDLTGNVAGYYGAVYVAGGSAAFSGDLFAGNIGARTGAIHVGGGTLNVSGSTFAGNYATDTSSEARSGAVGITVAGNHTISGSTFTGNTSGRDGGAIYLTNGSLTISNSVFDGNYARVFGGAIAQYSGTLTVSGSLFTGNSVPQYWGSAIYVGGGSAEISGSTFSGNANLRGAISVMENVTLTVSGSTFATSSDVIRNDGTLTLTGTNWISATVSYYNVSSAVFNTNDATLVFGNTTAISLAGLTMSGDNAMTFNGSAAVNFASQDLSDVSITVGTDNLPTEEGASFTIATGVAGMAETITVGGQSVTLGVETVIGGNTYTYALNGTNFTVTRETSRYDTTYAVLNGATSAVIGGTIVPLVGDNVFTTVDAAKNHLASGGRLIIVGPTAVSGIDSTLTTIVDGDFPGRVSLSAGEFSGGMNVTVENSAFGERIYVMATSLGKTDADVDLTFTGVTIADNLALTASEQNAVICKNVNISLTDCFVGGDVQSAGSSANPIIDGDITVTLTGSVVEGTVFGSRKNKISADRNINITFSGSTAGAVAKHDSGATTVLAPLSLTVTGAANSVIGSLSDVDKLTISAGSSVTFTTAQDLSATTLSVDGSAYAGVETTVASGVSALGSYTVTGADPSTFLKVAEGNLVMYTRAADVDDSVSEGSYTGTGTCLMTGGTFTGAFVGIRNPAANADVKNVISGGTVGNALIGGALVSSGSTATLDTVTLDIAGNAQIIGGAANGGMIYTAGYAYGADPNTLDSSATLTVAKSVLNLSAGSVPAQNLYAGAHARKGAYTVVGSTEINVSGGSFARIYGGGWAEKVGKSEVGSSTISVSGGIVDYIYAGGGNAEGGSTVVTGTVDISVSDDAQVGIAFLAGKNINCTTEGAVTMTVSGDAKTMTRVSGWNANGKENPSLTTLDLQTSLNVEYLDHVDVVRIAEGKTLDVSVDLWYEAASALKIDFDLDGALDTDWTAMSGVGMDIYRAAQYTIDGGATVYTYDQESGKLVNGTTESGYGLTFTSDNKVKFVTIA